jgi:hypothetical protein
MVLEVTMKELKHVSRKCDQNRFILSNDDITIFSRYGSYFSFFESIILTINGLVNGVKMSENYPNIN